MTDVETPNQARQALPIMLAAVALQVVGAIIMKLLADASDSAGLLLVAGGLAAVGALNLARLAVWAFAHRRFPHHLDVSAVELVLSGDAGGRGLVPEMTSDRCGSAAR